MAYTAVALIFSTITAGLFAATLKVEGVVKKLCMSMMTFFMVILDIWFAWRMVVGYDTDATADLTGMAQNMLTVYEISLVVFKWAMALVGVFILIKGVMVWINIVQERKIKDEDIFNIE